MTSSNPIADATAAITPNVEETVQRIRDLNEKLITAAKQSGNLSLDTYEKTLAGIVEFETKIANASQLDWISALVNAQTSFVSEVSSAYVAAARDALK